MFLFPPSLL